MYRNGAVSSAHKLATEAGLWILKQGGNAIDAAVSTALALSVVEPQNSGLGGLGGYATIYLKEKEEVFVVNFGSKAPRSSSPHMFVNSSNTIGHKAVSIPTVLKGLNTLSGNFGRIAFSECMSPSIKLAEEGFRINWALYKAMQEPHLSPDTRKVFQVEMLKEGDILRLPEYPQTLRKIQAEGNDVFYKGEIAERILETLREGGGIITQEDLADYQVKIESPGKINYHGFDVYFPLHNSGGPTMAQILKIAENFKLKELSDLELIEVMYHVMQAAFSDRFRVLEESTVSDKEILQLTDEVYCREIAKKIREGKDIIDANVSEDTGHTTHLCTADKEGNMVALTLTNGQLWFGSGLTVKGTGIVLNCGMSQYSTDPKHPNAPQPNRSNLSNMAPTIMLDNKKPFLAIGTPGSRRIITIVAMAIIEVIALKKSLKEALNQPRIHSEGKTLWVEKDRFTPELISQLRAKYCLEYQTLWNFYGSTTGIEVIDNSYYPEVDNRFPGSAGGY